MSSIEKDDPQQQQHPAPPPLLGALELATYRRGPFICLTGFHEVALGDAPVCDEGERGERELKEKGRDETFLFSLSLCTSLSPNPGPLFSFFSSDLKKNRRLQLRGL